MRFYEFTYRLKPKSLFPVPGEEFDNPDVVHREWYGSEREAVVRRLELYKSGRLLGKKSDHHIWGIDIPATKAGFLQWLRENVR